MIEQAIAEFCQEAQKMGYVPYQYEEEGYIGWPTFKITYQIHIVSKYPVDDDCFGMGAFHEMIWLARKIAKKYGLEETVTNHDRKEEDAPNWNTYIHHRINSICFYVRNSPEA